MEVIELPSLFPHQETLRDKVRAAVAEHGRVILCAQTGVGKCLGAGTPVMLSHGEAVPVERIRVGDRLLGPRSPSTVTSTCHGRAPLYRITPKGGGDPFVCNGDHILCLKMSNLGLLWKTCGKIHSGQYFTMTVDEFLLQSEAFRKHSKGYRCPAVEFEKPPHWSVFHQPPVDPYFLGIWLADGATRDPEITTADDIIVAHLEAMCAVWGVSLVFRGWTGNARTFAITDKQGCRSSWIRDRLRECVRDGRKAIDIAYKIASVHDRLALLAGFIDGDGSLSHNCYDIVQKSPQLVADIAFIARSVGLRVSISPCQKRCTNTDAWGDYFRMIISGNTHMIPCRLPHKQASIRGHKKNPLVFGVEVEPLGEGEYFGFELDGDRMFCLGDFTVTHNTRCAKWILGASANREPNPNQTGRSLFAVHRRGLVDNAVDSFNEQPAVPHGIIMSGRETHYARRIQIASIDTMLSWFVERGTYPSDITFDLLIFDEAHSQHPKFARFLQYHDARREELGQHPAYVIGLTATPRAQGLADVYKEIVLGPSTEWLISNGYLSGFRYFRATQGQLDKLVKRDGEFTKESEAAAMEGLAGDLVRDWKHFAEGRPTVGFFPRRSHAKDAMWKLEEAGLRVEYIDGETPDDERRRIFRALNEHDIDYLCNVQVVERGTDIPAIACVQLCVATASIVRYRQLIGRGSRVHPGKQDCIVIDHGGCIQRCGFFEDDPHWSLDITTKDPGESGTRPTIECPKCRAIYRGGRCRNCGYQPTPKERRAQGLQFDGRELKEVTRNDKPAKVKSAEELMISTLYATALSGRTWKQCVGIFKSRCEKQGTPHRVPRYVTVADHRYEMVQYGSPDGGRLVAVLYPFFAGGGHGGDYLVAAKESAGVPY